MTSNRKFALLTVLTLGLFAGPGFAEDKPAETCRTNKCHANMLEYRFSHAPTPDCETCHELKDKAKHKFALTSEVGNLCMTCHPGVIEGKPLRHSAVDDCTTCHHLHGAQDALARYLRESRGLDAAPLSTPFEGEAED